MSDLPAEERLGLRVRGAAEDHAGGRNEFAGERRKLQHRMLALQTNRGLEIRHDRDAAQQPPDQRRELLRHLDLVDGPRDRVRLADR